jgi:enoyl-CoA hydratase/carnithine racemase
MGLVPGDGGAFLLPRVVGLAKAMELLLTGDVIGSEEALSLGLVNRVVPHASLKDEAMRLAHKLSARPSQAVRMMKRAVYQGLTQTLRNHLDYISSQVALLAETRDHREAAKAFLEKRKPVFSGK